MIKSTKIEDAEFVMSKDELTYAEVIEDFEEASSIHILTYNISKDKSDLLKALKKCDEDTEICIVSNIPGRWEKYFGEYYKSKARKNISLYKSKLSAIQSNSVPGGYLGQRSEETSEGRQSI